MQTSGTVGRRWAGALALATAGLLLAIPGVASDASPAEAQAAEDDCTPRPSPDDAEPPCNPHLADSVWAANHRDSYAQASSPAPGPTGPPDRIDVHHEGIEAAPIIVTFSAPYPDGGFVVWGSTVGASGQVFKLDPDTFRMIDTAQPEEGQQSPGFSGAYNVLDRENRLISTFEGSLVVYGDVDPTDRMSPIEVEHQLELPDDALCRPDDEIIVGINMTYDGHVAFATSFGTVGVVPREPERMTAENLRVLSLNGEDCDDASVDDEDLEEVANTIAVDEDGGIYVITDTALYRIDRDGHDLAETWRVEYEAERDRSGSLGPGSGASPTLMGTGPDDDRFVVIYDDAEVFNHLLVWRDEIPADWKGLPGEDRRVACKVPVDFGRDDGEAWSEQSPLVRGYSTVLVSDRLQADPILTHVPSRAAGLNQLTGNVPGNEPRGVERIDWDPETRTCETVWDRPDVSIPNTIPTMSAATGTFYAVGARDGMWTLEALDWDTGETRFSVETSPWPMSNSFWAASTVGPDRAIYSGTFGGVTRWKQCDDEAEGCGRRPDQVEYLVGHVGDEDRGARDMLDGGDGGGPDEPDEEREAEGDATAPGGGGPEAQRAPTPATGGGLTALGLLAVGAAVAAVRRRPG